MTSPRFCAPLMTMRRLSGAHEGEYSSPGPSRRLDPSARKTTDTPCSATRTFRPSGETSGSPYDDSNGPPPALVTRCADPPSASSA